MRWDLRAALLIGGAALLGAAWALFNLYRVGGNGFGGATGPLVWAVLATPLATFGGWVVARWRERWLAALVCFCIYFFGILLAARLELLLLGADAADASGHALYFRLAIAIQLIAGLASAGQRAGQHGTMDLSTDS